jgi:hypothetical protein
MKRIQLAPHHNGQPTLADLIATVSQLTQDERLTALIVADMINSRQVRLEGNFQGRRVEIV